MLIEQAIYPKGVTLLMHLYTNEINVEVESSLVALCREFSIGYMVQNLRKQIACIICH